MTQPTRLSHTCNACCNVQEQLLHMLARWHDPSVAHHRCSTVVVCVWVQQQELMSDDSQALNWTETLYAKQVNALYGTCQTTMSRLMPSGTRCKVEHDSPRGAVRKVRESSRYCGSCMRPTTSSPSAASCCLAHLSATLVLSSSNAC